jgi:hypothetical protein
MRSDGDFKTGRQGHGNQPVMSAVIGLSCALAIRSRTALARKRQRSFVGRVGERDFNQIQGALGAMIVEEFAWRMGFWN